MKKVLLIFCALQLFSSNATSANLQTPFSLISTLSETRLSELKQTLENIVSDRSLSPEKPQHFYIVPYSKNTETIYLFWSEEKLLWIMPFAALKESWQALRYPSGGQLINLREDVVSTSKEVGESSYLVDQEWAEERLFETVVLGDMITIE